MRAVLQWSGLAAFFLSAFLLFLKMDIYQLSVLPTCESVDVGIQDTQSKSFMSLKVISLLMPNPCGRGKNRCLVSPAAVRKARLAPVSPDIFQKCKFLDEKLNDVDCSVERDTRDYVGEIHMHSSLRTNGVWIRWPHYKTGHGAGTGGTVRHYHLCYCPATRQFRWPFGTGCWEIFKGRLSFGSSRLSASLGVF